MRRGRKIFLVNAVALVGLVCLLAMATRVQAQEPLRWKFNIGEKLDYNMVQDMNMAAAGGPLGPVNTTMRQEMNMTWNVQGVDEKTGEAVIQQKFDRIKMKMTTPLGGFEYDSKSDAAPTGLGAMIAPMYKAMTEGEFEIVMSPRGEVKDVKIPDQVVAALKNTPGAATLGDLATADGFKKMISQGALVLPEDAPKEGDSWSSKIEMSNPAVGKQTVETLYRYEGTKDIDGVKFAVIRPQLTMQFENNPPAKPGEPQQPQPQQQVQMKIAEQSSDGEVLFNVAEGRLHTSTLTQTATIEIAAGGKSVQQKIDQKIDVKVKPAGEAEADAEAAESSEKSTEATE